MSPSWIEFVLKTLFEGLIIAVLVVMIQHLLEVRKEKLAAAFALQIKLKSNALQKISEALNNAIIEYRRIAQGVENNITPEELDEYLKNFNALNHSYIDLVNKNTLVLGRKLTKELGNIYLYLYEMDFYSGISDLMRAMAEGDAEARRKQHIEGHKLLLKRIEKAQNRLLDLCRKQLMIE